MKHVIKPHQIANIRESECIGCTKCIQACPVDAIVGASKLMHTVIRDVCTGCELCIPPCPVDCIDIIPSRNKTPEKLIAFEKTTKVRLENKEARLKNMPPEENLIDEIPSIEKRKMDILRITGKSI